MIEIITIAELKRKMGNWCRLQRAEHNISQTDLADELNMSRITIQQLEAGKNVTVDTLLKVMNHFGSLSQIFDLFDDGKKGKYRQTPDSLY